MDLGLLGGLDRSFNRPVVYRRGVRLEPEPRNVSVLSDRHRRVEDARLVIGHRHLRIPAALASLLVLFDPLSQGLLLVESFRALGNLPGKLLIAAALLFDPLLQLLDLLEQVLVLLFLLGTGGLGSLAGDGNPINPRSSGTSNWRRRGEDCHVADLLGCSSPAAFSRDQARICADRLENLIVSPLELH